MRRADATRVRLLVFYLTVRVEGLGSVDIEEANLL
jgi:hypothetical protein